MDADHHTIDRRPHDPLLDLNLDPVIFQSTNDQFLLHREQLGLCDFFFDHAAVELLPDSQACGQQLLELLGTLRPSCGYRPEPN